MILEIKVDLESLDLDEDESLSEKIREQVIKKVVDTLSDKIIKDALFTKSSWYPDATQEVKSQIDRTIKGIVEEASNRIVKRLETNKAVATKVEEDEAYLLDMINKAFSKGFKVVL